MFPLTDGPENRQTSAHARRASSPARTINKKDNGRIGPQGSHPTNPTRQGVPPRSVTFHTLHDWQQGHMKAGSNAGFQFIPTEDVTAIASQ
jgi:hypothetical protein